MRPMMGTYVEIAIDGVPDAVADAAMLAAFRAFELAESLWSTHRVDSDVSRLNLEAARDAVSVHPLTVRLLQIAAGVARDSNGAFDVTTGGELMRRGLLPRPDGADEPDDDATWRDIEIQPAQRVRFAKPLWIDLGGIAKGFSVDCAMEAATLPEDASLCINAGGDLRWRGPGEFVVRLASGDAAVALESGALASSDFRPGRSPGGTATSGQLVAPRGHRAEPVRSFVAVTAPTCAIADALTKVVQISGERSRDFLAPFAARAYLRASDGWRTLPA